MVKDLIAASKGWAFQEEDVLAMVDCPHSLDALIIILGQQGDSKISRRRTHRLVSQIVAS